MGKLKTRKAQQNLGLKSVLLLDAHSAPEVKKTQGKPGAKPAEVQKNSHRLGLWMVGGLGRWRRHSRSLYSCELG